MLLASLMALVEARSSERLGGPSAQQHRALTVEGLTELLAEGRASATALGRALL
ncbi:hypothetical protein [Oerskovia flava]|uniref:hypothetical protein n=1 Tax=Oerskovia flava TaxID=2986422 RepID=UPI00223E94BB|nr:hypothetical protein [Oerskovia sp. JB1-3-2]